MKARGVPSPEHVLRRTFWTLLFRGRAANQMAAHRKKKQMGLGLTLLLYLLFGVLFAAAAFRLDTFTFASLLHAGTFMFASLTLASSAGTMLFMREEAEILLHRPVTPQVLLRAKTSVLVAFALLLAVALNVAGLIAGAIAGGWRFFPAHLVSTVLLMVFSAACIVLVYNACLRWFGRERFDNLLTTLQVFLSIGMMAGGQIFPRLAGDGSGTGALQVESGWAFALPPVWFGALDAWIAGAESLRAVWLPASLALVATAGAVWLAFVKLGSAYGEGLMALNESRAPTRTEAQGPRRRRLSALLDLRLPRWWLRDPVERHAFLLTSAYLVRDREMKLKLYPALAPVLVMPVVMLLPTVGRSPGSISLWVQGFAACFLTIVPMTAMPLLARSEHWRASEFFRAAPLPHWTPLFHGARKAVLAWLAYPLLLLVGGVLALLRGSAEPLTMMLPALILLPTSSLVPAVGRAWLPLAEPPEEQIDAFVGCLTMIGTMVLAMAVGGLAMWMMHLGWFWPFLAAEALTMLWIWSALRRSLAARPWRTADA